MMTEKAFYFFPTGSYLLDMDQQVSFSNFSTEYKFLRGA
jgi:hypothetical protein